jgi:hypothetical protein
MATVQAFEQKVLEIEGIRKIPVMDSPDNSFKPTLLCGAVYLDVISIGYWSPCSPSRLV